jgi:acyl carrier protein
VPASSTFGGPGTVLITGAGGQLGRLFARHLARDLGVRRLLLVSRRGDQWFGAAELRAELTGLGAEVEFAACDVTDRSALAALLTGRELTGVLHLAGVTDDGTVGSLTPDRMDLVLGPKVDAALHLHELTADQPLTAFVVFSSVAGTFGNPGQANYAAANAACDALIARRRSAGLCGQSLAWGLWDGADGMAGDLAEADRRRMSRNGVHPLTDGEGTALFDAACARQEAVLVPVRLDLPALRAAGDNLPPLLRGLVRPYRRSTPQDAATASAQRSQLVALPPEQRTAELLTLLRATAAGILGHSEPAAVAPDRAFTELGFDSLTAVEFRNALEQSLGVRLPATLVFDHPNVAALAAHLAAELGPDNDDDPGLSEHRIREVLQAIPLNRLRDAGLLDALLELGGVRGTTSQASTAPDVEAATSDDIDALDMDSLINMAFDGTAGDGAAFDDATREA